MPNRLSGVIAADELAKRIKRGELIRDCRLKAGEPDVQPASYDLTAGRAVWTDSISAETKELLYDPISIQKPFVVLQPGQMMSIITHEEVLMPTDLCGMVFSKNRLALNGIFAFNSGHVDPGFRGPIVIRLINLRRSRFTVTLGDPIFTIVFQTLAESDSTGELRTRPAITMDETIRQVRQFADVALSNALFDLYSDAITRRLDDHRTEILAKLREDLSKEFVRKEKFGSFLVSWSWKGLIAVAGLIGLLYALHKIWIEVSPRLHW